MPDAIIDRINPTELDTITHLYNSIFRPERESDWIKRRMGVPERTLVQVARIDNDAVGFYCGYESRPCTHRMWLVGVVPDLRRTGVATQLTDAAEDWARTEGYKHMRFECSNRVRPFMHLGIAQGYDVVGMRYDRELMTNLVMFEKALNEAAE
ncbi:MAG: GNAT family N-acetyltransferase [Planctomycetota bacterium]